MKITHPSRMLTYLLASLCWLSICFHSIAVADESDKKTKTEESSSEPTKNEVIKVSGVFESVHQVELMVDAEQITSWNIKKLVDHGVTVAKGQNIVVFDSEDIDEQIAKSEVGLRLAKLALKDAEFEFEQFIETQKLDRAGAELARKNARQAHDNFVQVDRERQILTAEFTLKSSEGSFENAQEELEQLQQMYDEDDLTEESEEIVLKRAKRAVESALFRLEAARINSQRSIQQSIPNSEANQTQSLAKAELAYQKSIHDLNSSRQRREIEMRQKRDDFDKQTKKMEELKQERKQLVIRSPMNGFVLHGKLNRGRLGEKPSQLEPGSKVATKQVFATIVNPSKLRVRATLEQAKLSKVAEGIDCEITCDAFPEFKACGTVRSVTAVGFANGKYDCLVQFKMPKAAPAIIPTMTCQLHFSTDATEAGKSEHADKDNTNEN